MSRLLDTSPITTTVTMPIKTGTLDFLQLAWSDNDSNILQGLIQSVTGDTFNPTTPYVLSGCDITTGVPYLTPGSIFYNGEVFNTSGLTTWSGPDVVASIGITYFTSPIADPVTFRDTTTHNVHNIREIVFTNGTTGSGLFNISDLVYIYNIDHTWKTIPVSTASGSGGVTGTLYYRKDLTGRNLQIRASLTSNNAQNLTASPGALYYLMATMPSGYIPSNNGYFVAHYFLSNQIKDDLNVAWIKQINCSLNTSGQLLINWIKPDVSVAGYGINFNATLSLD